MEDEDQVVDQQEDDGQPDESNTEENALEKRFSKLEKALADRDKLIEQIQKESSGKDKKITELAEERKKLRETTLSKDKLLEIHEQELREKQEEWERQRAAESAELENLRREAFRTQVLAKIDNFPTFLVDRVRGNTPEEIEADARFLMRNWVKDQTRRENAGKVGGRPQSGSGRQSTMTAEEYMKLPPEQQQAWAASADPEDFNALFDEIHGA